MLIDIDGENPSLHGRPMAISKWALHLILLINLTLWGLYLIGWDWQGFKSYIPHVTSKNYLLEFLKYNFAQIIMVAVWVAGLYGLKGRSWPRIINFGFSAIAFALFTYIVYLEYGFDVSVGASRGALESLLISAAGLTANLLGLGYMFYAKLKPWPAKPQN